jgi:uncharacterized protein YlxP (DUF503 family)
MKVKIDEGFYLEASKKPSKLKVRWVFSLAEIEAQFNPEALAIGVARASIQEQINKIMLKDLEAYLEENP